MKKYMIIFCSAFITEICSTFYIRFVSDKNMFGMMFFAFIAPFLSLAFAGFMVESKLWIERLMMAFAMAFGYMFGSLFVIKYIH